MKSLGRLLTAMVTPFDEKGEVDYEQARKLALALIESGSDGVVVVGTTGESPTLTHEEDISLFAAIKEAVADRGSVVAGTGSNSTAEALMKTREAERIGVDACLLVVPYYNKPSQEGLYQHFKTIATSTSLPCILYNIPGRTGTNLSAKTTAQLSEIDNIIGTKDASGDLSHIANIIATSGEDFLVFSGNDSDTLPILSIGGYGVISVASHLAGKQMKEMINCAVEGKLMDAARMHRDLLPLFEAVMLSGNPVSIKYALNHIGFTVGNPRLPLVMPNETDSSTIAQVISRYRIDLPV